MAAVLLYGAAAIGLAWGLRASPWSRDQALRGKSTVQLEALAERHQEDTAVRYALAKQYYLEQRFVAAEGAYRRVLMREPKSARAHLGLGLTLFERGELFGAEQELQRALTLDPKLAWAEYMLGKVAWLRGNVSEALRHVQKSASLDPRSATAWYAVGVCHLQQRRYEAAVSPLQLAIGLDGGQPSYHTALGEVLVYLGRIDEGRSHLERAVELNPEYGPACAVTGGFYLRHASDANALPRAKELLLRAARLPTYHPEQVYLDLGDLHLQQRRYVEALKALRESVRLDPRDERPYFLLARVHRKLGDTARAEEAQARFQRISKLHVEMQGLEARLFHNPKDAPARLRLARVYREIGMAPSALAQYQTYLKGNPSPNVEAELRHWAATIKAGPQRAAGVFAMPRLQ